MTEYDVASVGGGMLDTATLAKETFGAALVTKTLDTLNTNPASGSVNADYDMQKDVLQAAYVGTGSVYSGEV